MLKVMIYDNMVGLCQGIGIVLFLSEALWVACCAARSNDAKFALRQSLTTDAPTHRLASLLAGQVGDRLDRA